jgi:DNA-binding NarL/FixJ family response regulator
MEIPGPKPGLKRVVVVDDHPVLRGVVRLACNASPTLEAVGEAEDGRTALELCRRLKPDLLVLDLLLPEVGGLEVARAVRDEGLPIHILALSGRADGKVVLECMRLDVEGFVRKTAGVQAIAEAMELVAAGGRLYSADEEREAVAELGRVARHVQTVSGVTSTLTPRETEILQMLGRGLTMRQVGNRLGISPRTVETHIAKLYRKLEVRTRVQAVARAAALGLIDLEDR